MVNKAGRKTKLTENEVNELIYLFKTENQMNGKIKYNDMYHFNKDDSIPQLEKTFGERKIGLEE
jgi:hypothetical protein